MSFLVSQKIIDPFGVLEEGEIFFQSSTPFEDPETGTFFYVFLGDAVVSRKSGYGCLGVRSHSL